MARMPTFTRKRIKAPSPPSANIESSKEAEESDEESSTTSDETSETSTYVDSSELSSSRESLNSFSSNESLKPSSSKGSLKASSSKGSLKASSSKESLKASSSKESLKASSSDESSESSSSEESSESSTEDSSDSESKSEDSEFASGESEAEMEEESSKDQTLSDQIKKIINGLEFSDEDTSRKAEKGKEGMQPRKFSFSGLLGQKGNNGSASQSSDENQFDVDSRADKNEKTEEKELKSMDNVSERGVKSVCTGKSEKNVNDLEETDDAERSKQIERPRRKKRRRVWWNAGVVARPINICAKEASKPLINQSPILAKSDGQPTENNTKIESEEQKLNSSEDISEREVLSGCMEKGDQVVKDLKETDSAVESNQMHKALQNSKGRVMCKKKEAFVRSQYCLRKAKIVDVKKLNACEPSPKQTCKPSPKQPCKPSPKQPCKPSPKQPCKPSPKQPCKPSPKQPCKPNPKQPCKPSSKLPCKPSPKQPCKPNPKQICKLSSKQPENVNRRKKTKPSKITPKTTDKVVNGKDKYSDSEATESAEESKLFMLDSDSDLSLRKFVVGILASRVMEDHCYYGNSFREDIKKVDEVIDSVIEGRPPPNAHDHGYSRVRSSTPPIVSFRLKKKKQKHPSNHILECYKNNLSSETMKNPVSHDKAKRYIPSNNTSSKRKNSFLNKDNYKNTLKNCEFEAKDQLFKKGSKSRSLIKKSSNSTETSLEKADTCCDSLNINQSKIGERRLRPARKAAIDAAQKITKSVHANSRSKGQNKLDLSKFVYPAVVKTEPVDSDTESSPEMHSFRTEDSIPPRFPSSATAQAISNVERNCAYENYLNFSHAIPPRSIVKTEPVETQDTPTFCPTYPNQPLNQFSLVPQTIHNVTSNYASENNSDLLASLYEDLIPIPVSETDQPEADRSSPVTHSPSLQKGDPVPSFVIFVDQALNPSNNTAQTIPSTGWNCASGNGPEQLPFPISITKVESLKTGTAAPETCLSSLETDNASLVDNIHQSQSFPLNISSVTPPLSSDSCLKMECNEEYLSETQYETLSKAHTHYNSVRDTLKDLIPGYETIMVLNTVPLPSKNS